MPDEEIEPKDENSLRTEYNEVFNFFVERHAPEVDLAGLIAYALYESQKQDWMIAYRRDHGRDPSAQEIKAMTGGYLNNDARIIYRSQASGMLGNSAAIYAEALAPSIREDALNNEMLRRAQAIEQALIARSGFWHQVGTGIIATLLWTLLVFAIVLTALAFGSDFVDMWQSINPATRSAS